MGGIHIVSKTNGNDIINSNTFPIYRGTVLGNPYTQIKDKKTNKQLAPTLYYFYIYHIASSNFKE